MSFGKTPLLGRRVTTNDGVRGRVVAVGYGNEPHFNPWFELLIETEEGALIQEGVDNVVMDRPSVKRDNQRKRVSAPSPEGW